MESRQEQDGPLGALEQYLRGVRWTEPLLDEEEAGLLCCIEQGRVEQEKHIADACILRTAEQARTRLIEGYQPLLLGLAKRYVRHCRTMELLDLVQEGNFGLLQATEKYDRRIGLGSFRTWAFSWVRGMMLIALWQYEGAIRLPQEKARAVRRLTMVSAQLCTVLGREPTLEEMAEVMGVRENVVRELMILREQHVVSLYAFTDDDGNYSMEETIVDPTSTAVEDIGDLLADALVMLPDHERLVIHLRYGFEDGQSRTQKEVASLLGVSSGTKAFA
jgi:RNA polymerase primary sigma factor